PGARDDRGRDAGQPGGRSAIEAPRGWLSDDLIAILTARKSWSASMPKYDRQIVVQFDFDELNELSGKAVNDYGNQRGIPSELVKVHGAKSTGGTYFD